MESYIEESMVSSYSYYEDYIEDHCVDAFKSPTPNYESQWLHYYPSVRELSYYF